jgi:Domain of unknown function (DUF4857)
MVRISRYILVLTAIIGSAIALPNLYWTIMEKPVNGPFVTFSCIDKTFMIQHFSPSGVVREDTKGNKLTREQYEKKLPMLYFMQLVTSGTMPDSINGVEMDMKNLRRARSTYRFQPKFMDSPQPDLYPLFESESGRVNLEMPDDFFRIAERVEFIEAKTNSVREEKSALFTDALAKRGFEFPSKIIAGLPTVKKSCDEGYLITDAKNQLFHLKMVKGKPYVKRINLPDNLSFKWIECVDFPNKQYYAYMISSNNEVYIVNQDTYELLKLPVEGFNPETDDLKIYGDFFNYNVIIEGDSYLKNFALDTKFNKVDFYEEKWNDRYHRAEGKVFDILFPFELTLKSPLSHYIDFRINYPNSLNWLLVSILLVAGQIFWLRRQKINLKNHLIDICLIAVTGIFGFIAVNVFQNKFFK